ncbi:cytochrome c oxidase subunit IV-domain-containing protein [Flammula alnicola]|nr:cytochrome c oxidase subunit IV-domain-containing protein [Flammula alnicola]
MQALRLARSVALRPVAAQHRCLATATAAPATASSSSRIAPVPLSNVEAQWAKLSADERLAVHEQLELLQQKDWKDLSIDEKKAAYYVAFGPHGPRTPTSQPGDNLKVFLSTMALVGVSAAIYLGIQASAPAPPKTMNKEWQEASNERAKEQKLNPISGITSEGYSGKGYVQSK